MMDDNEDNIIWGFKPGRPRSFTEQEARAVATLLWWANDLARVTIATWMIRRKRPTMDELNFLSLDLCVEEAVVNLAKGPPSDGHALDDMIAYLQRRSMELREESTSK